MRMTMIKISVLSPQTQCILSKFNCSSLVVITCYLKYYLLVS